jgi:hypothetical protein
MTKRSLRDLLRNKRTEKMTLTPEMRGLMDSFEAKYGQRAQDRSQPNDQERRDETSDEAPATSSS